MTINKDDYFTMTKLGGGGASAAGPEDPLHGIRSALKWQDAWMMAIALAWSDKDLEDALIGDPVTFFAVHCNYRVPDGITLTVSRMDADTKDAMGRKPGWDPANHIWFLKKSELTMYLPPKPDQSHQAVALSAYLATGRTYPFTSL
ncbi:BMA_0021/BMA_0022 family TOMM bacteriocin [Sorangium sp. So ce131]|uniref:BMA_0021/BMA_0022 family TOMM bacteriocin n=1 Tax=Sorangium sp. So ce131 TaxID=3133282 RepID=UPI003F633B76